MDTETKLPFHFDPEVPLNKAVMSDKTTVAGKEVKLEFIGISPSDLKIEVDLANIKI